MKNHKDIYTLNRENPDAIIYLDSDGKIIRLTREDFSSDEEFRRWKEWSDQQYKLEAHEANAYRIRKVMLVEGDLRRGAPAISDEPTPDRMSRKKAAALKVTKIRRLLTAKQYRRLWLYGAMEMTEEEIARFEGISHQAVSKSLRSAVQRIHRHMKM